ncbi:MAG TPA: hypothetical protein DCS35_04300 [Vibrio sp.]|uniref:hypothetical protein n=1 Tax=Pseudomonas sp. C27(2019) TaxID=2604941 RepID=UPI000E8C17DB|nr:hypothetical protein [Pseudomonas sp. C27(2019)]QEY59973.1 hypothetical protein FXF61_12820 [Pseudomonas sp. C27(2019)]HAS61849.1 hypothetical protein [Vibrio sp.]
MKHLVKHCTNLVLVVGMTVSLSAYSDDSPTAVDIQQAAAQAMEMDIDRQIGGNHPELKKEIMKEMPTVKSVALQSCVKQKVDAYRCVFTLVLDLKGQEQAHDSSAVMTKDESGDWTMSDIK